MNPNDESFIDEVTLSLLAGDGGDGCMSMRREKFVPRGGPNGGDGGRGGDVIFVADRSLSTLHDWRMRREIRAESGAKGGPSNKTGKTGAPEELRVPVGTIVYDLAAEEQSGEASESAMLVDLAEDGQRFIAARSGRGGRGNARFATATRQTPDFAERGQPGQIRRVRLSLKLLADVGLVGFPNAGKSTLLRRISAAKPRVAAYPFTTLTPSLGVVEADDRRFVVADIPGLIEGASRGIGLGDRFLRHIERTRLLVHLLDAGSLALESADLDERYAAIRHELEAYEPALAQRRELVVLSKIDLVSDREALDAVEQQLSQRGRKVLRVSSATGEGIPALVRAMQQELDAATAQADADAEAEASDDVSQTTKGVA